MARFFLNIRNGGGLVEDAEGLELPDLEAARGQAIDGVRSLLSEEVRHGRLDMNGSIEIHGAQGELLLCVPFGEAVEINLCRLSA